MMPISRKRFWIGSWRRYPLLLGRSYRTRHHKQEGP